MSIIVSVSFTLKLLPGFPFCTWTFAHRDQDDQIPRTHELLDPSPHTFLLIQLLNLLSPNVVINTFSSART